MDRDALSRRDVREYFGRTPGRWRPSWRRGLGPDDGAEMALHGADEGRSDVEDDVDDGRIGDSSSGRYLEQTDGSTNPLSKRSLSSARNT